MQLLVHLLLQLYMDPKPTLLLQKLLALAHLHSHVVAAGLANPHGSQTSCTPPSSHTDPHPSSQARPPSALSALAVPQLPESLSWPLSHPLQLQFGFQPAGRPLSVVHWAPSAMSHLHKQVCCQLQHSYVMSAAITDDTN